MEQILQSILIEILNMSLTASVMIIAVFLARIPLKKAPGICAYALWGIVLFRLLCPISFESDVSLLGFLQNEPAVEGRMEYIHQDIGYQLEPQVHMPVEAVNDAVNHSLPAGNPQGSVNPMQIVLYLAVRIWILGILLMFLYSGISLYKLQKRLKSAVWERDNIYRMSGNTSPFVYGIFKPRIYLPEDLSENELEYILLHEQIHIKRGDQIYRMLAYLALCIHWFNPLVWAAFSFSGRDMEISCDEAVIRTMGSGVKKEYSASLLNLAHGSKIVKGIPVAFGESDTGSRIKHVLKYQKPAKIFAVAAVVACAILTVVLLANPAEKDSEYSVYGVVTYAELEGPQQMVVNLPRVGHVLIPEAAVGIYPYLEGDNPELEEGDLIKITFYNENVEIQESYPARFAVDAKSIEVKGKGFAMNYEGANVFCFALPEGLAPGAEISDTVEIYQTEMVGAQEKTSLLASKEVVDVDRDKNYIWTEFSMEEMETFLEQYGLTIYCNLIAKENSYEETTVPVMEDGEFDPANPQSGIYSISLRSVAKSARCVDRYVADTTEDLLSTEKPALYFADNCDFFVNWQWTSTHFEEVSFDEFANLVNDKSSDMQNVPCNLTFQNGLITKAELLNGYYKYGIEYQPGITHFWYENIMQSVEEAEGVDALETYYTLVNTLKVDFADYPGEETVEIYTGDTGDGDSGLVLFKDEQGEVLYSDYAHVTRVGWNNIYLGEDNGAPFIMTVHIEDRDTNGEYSYQVFDISFPGMVGQKTGSSFEWGDFYTYDDELFKEWVSGMEYYLERSYLLLSSQEGEIRTEQICELDKYNYETLKRE